MKNKLTTLVPAVALLALSSCASTSGLTSTESDGVYYSSKDRTTQTATASIATDNNQYATQGQGIDEDTNPEYSGNSSNGSSSGSAEYYDDSYASRLGRFNNSSYSGLSYYSPVYTDPYFMGGGYGSAFSPYYGLGYGGGFYDPFYSSMYSPYGYGFGGSYLSIGLGFGSPWGYRPYGLGYGGYGGGFYDPYYSGLYGGGYGLGYGYGYGNSGYSGYWGGGDNGRRNVRYAPRVDRTREAVSASQPVGGSAGGGRGGRYVSQGGLMASPNTSGVVAAPNTSVVGNAAPSVAPARARGRLVEAGTTQPQQTNGLASPNNNYNLNERLMSETEQRAREGRTNRRMLDATTQSAEQPSLDYSGRGRRSQIVDNSNAGATATPQDYQPAQRRGRLSDAFRSSEINSNQNRTTPQRSYETRTYSEPARTYSEPARMSSPAPSYGGSSGGGGNFGGGGGGGGGRGRIR
ncbi:hypothetical protein [Hymenobacter sp. GOD-10R]|uniref:hypothetical protein n=1 Tax=Hymenobacter sp. GOD-10R TaxID=3093922 RepID=UPI002D765BB8|nr:hypothetical protein [Hymenobacter sp. GOD-10R]WRQ28331.1 hypothetical protein SD425_25000 [Hymenobacter sp. GOD-10R]